MNNIIVVKLPNHTKHYHTKHYYISPTTIHYTNIIILRQQHVFDNKSHTNFIRRSRESSS